MPKIKGTTIVLYEKNKTGENDIGEPIYSEQQVEVEDVLVAPVTSDDLVNNLALHGKKITYQLAIPKGDTHNWKDAKVSVLGQDFTVYTDPIEGIEENIPLSWNKKVYLEKYEQL